MAFVLALGACGDAEPEAMASIESCGSGLDELLAQLPGAEPPLDASYSDALAAWPPAERGCGLGVFSGRCADGKRLLYRNGGFGSETRYFEGEQLVGSVLTSDVGVCPSVCPFSHFYGALDSVRCDAPNLEDLCVSSSVLEEADLRIPFSDGRAPGGCGGRI